jgi:hypothetical protein
MKPAGRSNRAVLGVSSHWEPSTPAPRARRRSST